MYINSSILRWLQSVLNAAVRVVFSARKFDHTTTLLCELHWLKVPERVKFRLCVLTFRYLNGTAPRYLAETIRQSLAVAHIITSDPLRCQPYWCCPCIVRPLETGHSLWLLHGHGMPYHNSLGTRLLFLFFAENWKPFCSGRRFLMWSDNELCFVYMPMYWLLQTNSVNTVRWSCSSNAIISP